MNRFALLIIFCSYLFALMADCAAQSVTPETESSATSRQSGSSSPGSSSNTNGKNKKKKKKKSAPADDLQALTFDEDLANAVMSRLRDGLEGHSQRLMLSAFDADNMKEYPTFENQIEAFFNHYLRFRVYFRILQAAAENEKGTILAEVEMEALPGADTPPVRKHDQLHIEVERNGKGWKIVELKPRDFFS